MLQSNQVKTLLSTDKNTHSILLDGRGQLLLDVWSDSKQQLACDLLESVFLLMGFGLFGDEQVNPALRCVRILLVSSA